MKKNPIFLFQAHIFKSSLSPKVTTNGGREKHNLKSETNRKNYEQLAKSLSREDKRSIQPQGNIFKLDEIGQLTGTASQLLPRMPFSATYDVQQKSRGSNVSQDQPEKSMPPISHVFLVNNFPGPSIIDSEIGPGHKASKSMTKTDHLFQQRLKSNLSGPHLMKGPVRIIDKCETPQPTFENDHLLFDNTQQESMDDHLMKNSKVTKYKPDCFCPRCEILRQEWRLKRIRFYNPGLLENLAIASSHPRTHNE